MVKSNNRKIRSRSHEPVFWSLFGAGGVVVAFILPMLIFITGVAWPLGWVPTETLAFSRVHTLLENPFGKLFLFIVISLCLWHGCHRVFLSLHDFGIHKKTWQRWMFYGFAAVGSTITLILVNQ